MYFLERRKNNKVFLKTANEVVVQKDEVGAFKADLPSYTIEEVAKHSTK